MDDHPDVLAHFEVAASLGLTEAQWWALPEDERAVWVARHARETAPKCGKCGGDPAVCSDAEKSWYPQRTVCYADMETQAARARYADLHEDRPYHNGRFRGWSEKRSRYAPYKYDEGVTIWAAPVDFAPDDDFLARARPDAEPDGPGEDER